MTTTAPITLNIPGTPAGQPRPLLKLRFKILGDPAGQPRHIPMVIKTKSGKMRGGVRPSNVADDWITCIWLAARTLTPTQPMTGPVVCNLTWLIARPEYMQARKYRAEAIPCTAKPDRDNLDKVVLDTLTKLQFWQDDKQAFLGRIGKYFCAKDPAGLHGRPGCIVELEELGDECIFTPEYIAAKRAKAVGP